VHVVEVTKSLYAATPVPAKATRRAGLKTVGSDV